MARHRHVMLVAPFACLALALILRVVLGRLAIFSSSASTNLDTLQVESIHATDIDIQ